MQLSEKEIEDFMFDDLCYNRGLSLTHRGLTTVTAVLSENEVYPKTTWYRQFNLGLYGILDIVGFYRYKGQIFVELFELKAVPIKSEDFEQILRYKTGIMKYINRERPNMKVKFYCYLIGRDFESGHYMHNNLKDFVVSEYSYNLGGIQFRSHDGGDWCKIGDQDYKLLERIYG